jgi:hypothetical protein
MNKIDKETIKLMNGDKFTYICVLALLAIVVGIIFPFIHQSSDGSILGSVLYFSITSAVALLSGIGGYISFKPVAKKEAERGEI